MSFSVLKKVEGGRARRGVLQTAHGEVQPPVFMPVGTRATVKTMTPHELVDLGAEIILGNTYHLCLRPGSALIAKAGGLHQFCSWQGAMLTDSGGYQVFSLAALRKIRPDGVEFASHIDGTRLFLGPKESLKIQRELGSDVAMAFDECTPYPCAHQEAEQSLDVTLRWEATSREQPLAPGQQLFGIVQGSTYEDLRRRSAAELVKLGFDGYAVGGLSVGEPEAMMMECLDWTLPCLPEDKPRYLMGVGTPRQIVMAVGKGVDMFDCVIPTRLARHGSAYVGRGETAHIKAGRYAEDFGPVEAGCACYPCRNFSRAYIRHLFNVGEILAMRLLTIHNLHYYLGLMRRTRQALEEGTFTEFSRDFLGE